MVHYPIVHCKYTEIQQTCTSDPVCYNVAQVTYSMLYRFLRILYRDNHIIHV